VTALYPFVLSVPTAHSRSMNDCRSPFECLAARASARTERSLGSSCASSQGLRLTPHTRTATLFLAYDPASESVRARNRHNRAVEI